MKTLFKNWLGGIIGGFLAVGMCVGIVAANAPGATLGSAKIWVGNASGVAAPVDISSDATISNTGALTLAANSVATAEITANTIVSADVSTAYFQVDNTQLTNTNVINVRATPITLIADPGDGFAVLVHSVYVVLDDAAGAWTESDDNLVIEYATGQDILMIEATGFLGGAVAYREYKPIRPVVAVATAGACSTVCGGGVASTGGCLFGFDDGAADAEVVTDCADTASDRCFCQNNLVPTTSEAVRLLNIGNGEWGGGNAANTLSIRIYYSVVPTAAFSSGG